MNMLNSTMLNPSPYARPHQGGVRMFLPPYAWGSEGGEHYHQAQGGVRHWPLFQRHTTTWTIPVSSPHQHPSQVPAAHHRDVIGYFQDVPRGGAAQGGERLPSLHHPEQGHQRDRGLEDDPADFRTLPSDPGPMFRSR